VGNEGEGEGMNWKPIRTAPDDSTVVDIWSAEHGRCANYVRIDNGSGWVYYEPVESGVCCIRDATHWLKIESPIHGDSPTKIDNFSLDDKEALVDLLLMVQSGHIAYRRMASEIVKRYKNAAE